MKQTFEIKIWNQNVFEDWNIFWKIVLHEITETPNKTPEATLESSRPSTMEVFSENNQRLKVDCKKAPS